MNVYDIYKDARRIAQELTVRGISVWADRIEDAIASGSTGTEILMALQWNLQELQKSSIIESQGISRDVANLIDEIGMALRSGD